MDQRRVWIAIIGDAPTNLRLQTSDKSQRREMSITDVYGTVQRRAHGNVRPGAGGFGKRLCICGFSRAARTKLKGVGKREECGLWSPLVYSGLWYFALW